jgi:(4-O-methyl)-D-glucuronate---lignin esterase
MPFRAPKCFIGGKQLEHGSFKATVDASRLLTLLGAHGLGVSADYHTATIPPVNHGLLDRELAWRQHDGGHTGLPNMKYFIQWADKFIGHAPPQ